VPPIRCATIAATTANRIEYIRAHLDKSGRAKGKIVLTF
jgi:hypothetical protein